MIKLLTTLLIAGLSAIAYAEPVVYYCNTIKHAFVDTQGVATVQSIPLRIFIERDTKTVQIKGVQVTGTISISDSVIQQYLSFWPPELGYGDDAFYGGNWDSTVEFRHNTLAVTQVGFKRKAGIGSGPQTFMLNAFLAECDKS